jgi:HSP20 family molecular chaperone IbpA
MTSPTRYTVLFITVVLLCHHSFGERIMFPGETQKDESKEDHHVAFPRHGWGCFAPIFALDNYWNNTTLSGPSYKIEVDDNKIELTYDVRGYDKDNLTVEIRSGVLSISGEKRSEDSDKFSISSFHHTFSVDPNVHYEDVSAQITLDNELVVSVSKKRAGSEPRVSNVPILSLGQRVVE